VELFVLPGPDQRLAHQVAGIVPDIECGHATGDRFLSVRHRNDLFAFESQHQEPLALQVGPIREFH
jgi:hypothetical protein